MLTRMITRRRTGCQIIALLISVFMILQVSLPTGITHAEAYQPSDGQTPDVLQLMEPVKNEVYGPAPLIEMIDFGEETVKVSTTKQEYESRPGEFVVHFNEDISETNESRVFQSANLSPGVKKVEGLNARLVKVGPGSDPAEVIAKLKKDPRVQHVEPNYLFKAQLTPAEPLYSQQWGMAEIQAEYAWKELESRLTGNENTLKVAVIDTGVDSGHEDLAGKVLPGYNCITGAVDEGNTADDSQEGHGTHVAGIMAAVYDNAKGIAGAAGGFPVKVLPVKALDSAGIGTMLDLAQGIRWAVNNGAKVINLSLGARLPDYPLTLAEAVRYAQDRGVLVVAAAGNEGNYSIDGFYPACLPGVTSVGASGKDHHPADFSNRGSTVMAPGVDIISTVPGNKYSTLSGTSMAAPFVSATAAMLWLAYPQKTSTEVAEALRRGYRDFSEGCTYYWWGRVCDYRYYVFSAYRASGELTKDLNSWPWLEFIQPNNDQSDHVSGIVDLSVRADYPMDIARVDFSLEPDNYDEPSTIIGTVNGPSESGLFNLTWDSTSVDDGPYTICAEAFDAAGESLTDNDIDIIVSNNAQDGFVINVKKPDGTPAAGAKISVFHAVYRPFSWGDNFEYERIWDGNADFQGRTIISGTDATDGNDFLITALGSEPNFLYYRTVRAPAQVTLDGSDAQQLTVTGWNTAGQPLAEAVIVGDLLESSLPFGQGSKESVSHVSGLVMSVLNAEGKGEITLTRGKYNIRLISEEDAYYLIKNDITIDSSISSLDFAPRPDEVATVKPVPETKYTDTGMLLSDGNNYYYGFQRVDSGREVTVYPGSYSAVIDAVYRDPYFRDYNGRGLDWLRRIQTPEFTLASGESKELAFKDISYSNLTLPDGHQGYFTNFVYLDGSFLDVYGNMTTYLATQPYIPAAAGLETETVSGRSSGILKMALPKVDNISNEEATETEPPQAFIYDPPAGQFQPIVQTYTEVRPSLEIKDAQNSIQPGDKGAYYASYNNAWTAYWFVPADQSAGEYKAKIKWAAGPLGPSQGLESPEFGFALQKEQSDVGQAPISVRITNLSGSPMAGAEVLLLEKETDGYSIDEKEVVDSLGKVDFWEDIEEGDNYALAILGPAGSQWPEEKALLFYPLSAESDYQDLNIDLADYNLKQIHLEPRDEKDLPLDNQECLYSVTGLDSGGLKTYSFSLGNSDKSYFGIWVPDGKYIFEANIASIWDYPRPPLYRITEEVNVPQDLLSGGLVEMGGSSLAELSVYGAVPAGEDREPYKVGAVALFKEGEPLTPAFYPIDKDQKIMVSPGNYEAVAVISREHYDDNWVYWMANEIEAASGSAVVWAVYGNPFTASVELDTPSYGLGSTLKAANIIQDAGGNRLVGIATDMDIGFYPSAETGDPVQGQNHQEIAPFFVIQDPSGKEIYRFKEPAYDPWELEDWEGGGWGGGYSLGVLPKSTGDINIIPQYSEDIAMVSAPGQKGTYFGGSYTFTSDPEQAEGGTYTALLELGVGPEGMVRGSKSFVLEAVPGVTLDNISRKTNAQEVTITGRTMANVVVTVNYRINGGGNVAAGTTAADSDGQFSINVALPEEGHYEITAFASRGGISGRECAPINLTVDRTPPDMPIELAAVGQDQAHILLTWQAPTNSDVAGYRIYRNGSMVAEFPEGQVHRYLDGTKGDLQPGLEYEYQVMAVDEAGNISAPAEAAGKTSGTGDLTAPTPPGNLRVTVGLVGSVELEWQAAIDNIGVKGYRIWRGEDENPPQVIDYVYGNDLRYKDSGLDAETLYIYYVTAFDDAGNESASSNRQSITTPEIKIHSINWKIPRLYYNGPAEYAGSLELSLLGEPNRRAVAEIVYMSWLNETGDVLGKPLEKRAELEFNELSPGAYTAVFAPPPGTIESLRSVKGVLSDRKGHSASRDVTINLKYAGLLRINVGTNYNDVPLDIISGSKISAWSTGNRSGDSKVISELGTYKLSLAPGDDYSLRLFTPDGAELSRRVKVLVAPGREQELTISTELPASLNVQVVEAQNDGTEVPVSGVRVNITNNRGLGYLGDSDEAGIVRRLGQPDSLVIPLTLSGSEYWVNMSFNDENRLIYKRPDSLHLILKPGPNEGRIVLTRRLLGEIRGRVTNKDGKPLEGANVVINQHVDPYIQKNYSVSTDDDGSYSLPVVEGLSSVGISHPRHASSFFKGTVKGGEVTTFDACLAPTGVVSLTVYATPIGEAENLVPMIFNRAEITLVNKRTGYSWRPNGRSPVITLFDCLPGDVYEVRIDGKPAGFTSQTQTVTLDSERVAEAEFHLIQLGQVKARVRKADGGNVSPLTLRADLCQTDGKIVNYGNLRIFGDQMILSGVPEGTYTIELYEGTPYQSWWGAGYRKPSPDSLTKIEEVIVTPGEVNDLGDISLPQASYSYTSRFDGPGNGFTTADSVAAPGSIVNLRAAYSYKGSEWSSGINDVMLYLDIPRGTSLVENSIVTRVVYGPGEPNITVSGNRIIIELTDRTHQQDLEGVVTYQVKLTNDPDWPTISGRAMIGYLNPSYNLPSGIVPTTTEVLGQVSVDVPYASINGPKRTGEEDITVSGRAPAGSSVKVYDGQFYLGETQVNRYGAWKMDVQLPDLGLPSEHYLYVSTNGPDGREIVSPWFRVTAGLKEPVLTSVKMYQPGKFGSHTFYPNLGYETPYFSWNPTFALAFDLQFNDNEAVYDVKIWTGNRGSYLTANFDGQKYTASGYAGGYSQVPGDIYVTYKKRISPSVFEKQQLTEEQLRRRIPWWAKDFELLPAGGSGGTVSASNTGGSIQSVSAGFALPQFDNSPVNVNVTINSGVNYTPSQAEIAKYQETGIPLFGLSTDLSETNNGTEITVIGYMPAEMVAEVSPSMSITIPAKLVEVATKVKVAAPYASLASKLKNGWGNMDKYEKLNTLLDALGNCSSSDASNYRDKLDSMNKQILASEVLKATYGVLAVAAGAASVGIGAAVVGVIGLAYGLAADHQINSRLDTIKQGIEEDCEDEEDDDDDDDSDDSDDDDRPGDDDKIGGPRWGIDPSGFVYEAVYDNRIAGVTATALEWNTDQKQWMVWDASECFQENPLITDNEGKYAWDVTEGLWKVSYFKTGYDPAESWEMYVPPPRMDVNVGIVSPAAPNVAAVAAATDGGHIDITFDKYMLVESVTDITVNIFEADVSELVYGEVAPLSARNDPSNSGIQLAKVFRFIPDEPLTVGNTYEVKIDEMAQSYASRPMSADYMGTVLVTEEITPPPSDPGTPGGSFPPNEIKRDVGPGAQKITAFDGEVNLEIPAGAFSSMTSLVVRKHSGQVKPELKGMTPVSPVYEINTGKFSPIKPIFLTIKYDKTLLKSTDPRKLGIYHKSSQQAQWNYVGGSLNSLTVETHIKPANPGQYAVMAYEPDFVDSVNHWSRSDVEILASRHVVVGTGPQKFSPERSITRAEMTALLVKMLSLDGDESVEEDSNTNGFRDVLKDSWYYDFVSKASRYGFVQGSNSLFRPNDPVTREEMAAMLVNAMGYKTTKTKSLTFVDASAAAPWARNFIAIAKEKGLMQGDPQNRFHSKTVATRAEAAVVTLRAMERRGLISRLTSYRGQIAISDTEGRHYVIKCPTGQIQYTLIPDNEDIRQLLDSEAGKEAQVTGLLLDGVSLYMQGPVLRVLAIGDEPKAPGG